MVIRYRYAYNSVGKTIDVNELPKERDTYKEKFECLGCNNILTPVLGEKRRKHFRHKVDVDCSPETYLHKLAKTKFYEVYIDCLQQNKSFLITIEQEQICNYFESDFLYHCHLGDKPQTFDLTKFFRKIYVEEKEDSFIPDLLLVSDKGDKLFIEIAVTHQSTEAKINSEYRLIEIDITEEDDLEIISSKKLACGEKVSFFNFKSSINNNLCGGKCFQQLKPYAHCIIKYKYFVIFKNGKSAILDITLHEIENLHKNSRIKYGEFIDISDCETIISNEYIRLVIESFVNNRDIKNCFLCRYHGDSYNSSDPIYCKFLKKSCGSNEAANCEYYRPDTKVFPAIDLYD